jgi:hypothetical protein
MIPQKNKYYNNLYLTASIRTKKQAEIQDGSGGGKGGVGYASGQGDIELFRMSLSS